jgi:RimJ/RimL family protein N-acetyltransferase
MRLVDRITGPHMHLRTAEEDDAGFILTLRLDPDLSKYIGSTDASIEKQRHWLRQKIHQENDYHMIIEANDASLLGVIALYHIDFEKKTFEWGRWIVKPAAPPYTALESALLCYILGFEILNLEKAVLGVMNDNVRTISFHKKFGATLVRQDSEAVWFEYTVKDFDAAKKRYSRYLMIK